MKLSIITEDNAVGKDERFYHDLDLSTCGIPSNVWALQWDNTSGHIEYKGAHTQNEDITELPAWAEAAHTLWQNMEDARLAAEEAARLAEIEEARLAEEKAQAAGIS
jgi:hypothetical protein